MEKARNYLIWGIFIIPVFFIWPIMATGQVNTNNQKLLAEQQANQVINTGNVISQDDVKKDYVEGEVLVKFKKGMINLSNQMGKNELSTFARNFGLSEEMKIDKANLALFKNKEKTTNELVNELKKDLNVEYAQPNYIYSPMSIPNDTEFSNLWGLHNTGQNISGISGTVDADIDAPEAWDLESASWTDTVVAVIDSGVAYNHPDLINNVVAGWDFVDNDNTPFDDDGHGTHIAGIIAAEANNSQGVIGLSRYNNLKIMPLRTNLVTAQIIAAINYAKDNNAQVINASWGGPSNDSLLKDAIDSFEGLFITAAGNEGLDHNVTSDYPCDFNSNNIICIAATDQNDSLASWSDYGGNSVDIAAPGKNIYSTEGYRIFDEDFQEVTPPDIGTNFTKGGNLTWGTYEFNDGDIEIHGDLNYPYNNNVVAYLNSDIIDLSSNPNSYLNFDYWCDTEYNYDYLILWIYNGSEWNMIDYYTGYNYGNANYSLSTYSNSNFMFSLEWLTDGSVNDYYGCWVDNIKVVSPSSTNGSYQFMDGTSMAAPYVSGLAGLVWSHSPSLTIEEVKNIILTTGDTKSSLVGKTVTGKRINLYNALKSFSKATLSELPSNPTNSTSASIRVDGIDVVSFKYKLDNGNYSDEIELPIRYIYNLNNLTEGQHTVYVIGKDSAGNWQNESEATQYTWTIDITPPIISGADSDTLYTHPVTITYNEGEGWRYTYENDHIPFASGTTFSADGKYMIWVRDAAGNEASLGFTIDQNPPVISIKGDNPYNIVLGSSWTDPGATALDTVDGDLTSQMTSISTVDNQTVGDYTVTYTVKDSAGYSATAIRNVHVFVQSVPTPTPIPTPTPTPTPAPAPAPTPAPAPIPKVLGVSIGTPFIVAGTKNGGGPEVRVLTTAGKLLKSFNAYVNTFHGGVNVAVGDINGDDSTEIITSPREGGAYPVKIFDVSGKNLKLDFYAYDKTYKGGVNITTADINADGKTEIITAPMGGSAPYIRIFALKNGKMVRIIPDFLAYDKNFRGGVAVSVGDINGDGKDEIVTSPTSKGGPQIQVFGFRNNKYVPITPGIMAYASTFRGGINSTAGDVNGDGKDEIMTGIVSAGGPHVRIFGLGRDKKIGLISPGFMAYSSSFRGGISVVAADVNGDGKDEIITGIGSNGLSTIKIFDQKGKQVLKEFNAYAANYKYGVTVAAGQL